MTGACERLFPEVLGHLLKLALRHDSTVTKKRRIWDLSYPRCRIPKYEPPALDIANRNKTRIVRLEEPVLSRSEQLSLPRSRTLLELKKTPAFYDFEPRRKSNVNRRVRKSLLSMYSRLGNVQPPKRPIEPTKLTKAQLHFHLDYAKRLAKPKVYPNPPQEQHANKSFSMKRTRELAFPKLYYEEPINEWTLTRNLRNYEPSQRIKDLARPKRSLMVESYSDPFKVKRRALHYVASRRIVELANLPSYSNQYHQNISRSTNTISPAALSAKASKRTLYLAEPRVRTVQRDLPVPYVSRKALKAKVSQRLIELAKPKQYYN